ncbi:hypothetical protein C4552_00870 [Candidatus Parcubacteria bacterium]|nr:MAG: hypothetical protein C4552_00870 [Candidatus Parcubacteria bacterium]
MADTNGTSSGSPFAGVIVVAAIVFLAIGFFQSGNGGIFGLGGGDGPIATGSSSDEIRNPQPAGDGGGIFGSVFRRRFTGGGTPPPSPPPSGAPPSPAPTPPPGISPYQSQIVIASVRRSEEPGNEYVVIRRSRSSTLVSPINVTGWRIQGLDAGGTIPRAYDIPEIDVTERDIFLPPGGEVIVLTGTPAYQRNFRENQCIGYLNQTYRFVPGLSSSCPDDNPSRSALLNRGFSGACIDFIQRIPACRTPAIGFEQSGLGLACTEYIAENFNYMGCVANFRDESDFRANRWRVYLGYSRILFDPRHDAVELRDQNGLLVDRFEY